VALSLTVLVRRYGDAELVTAIRHGVRADDSVMVVMPSQAFAPLADADLGRIFGYLRSLPSVPGLSGRGTVGPIGRMGLVLARPPFNSSRTRVFPPRRRPVVRPSDAIWRERPVPSVMAPDLRGASHPEGVAPDLRIVTSYTAESFATLMRTGLGIGGRELGVMTPWAASYCSSLTVEEVNGPYVYSHTPPRTVSE